MSARAAAVIVAGGSGRRFGGPVRKQYLEIGGEPVLLRAVRAFLHHPRIASVVVVLPPDDVEDPPRWLADLPVTIVAGGAERGDSVFNGLMAVDADADADRVLVHDGARPFVTADVIDRVLDAEGGAIAAVPVTDTIQRVDADGVIVDTPDRAALWQAQTPQGFPRAALVDAYRRARADGVGATDDAAVFARYAGPVRVVMGAHRNLKVTRPEDLPIAEVLARGEPG
ncbi:2-C-methyl-D-erythritol 4-phosphate cytidylyltransferase [Longimicrobium sp.]|uniref:2-C-methyl-D-erythritol 4-phosphate cytidylyltransferase n=1 Tax=Longimicrobium sp. TaxID=2029185 RepID=UPI002E3368DB|nr:2-C-methyl-D-erythritol 4-phosphate cytidylyltransferase [Longimicrobium sp.]HEX6042743.1 2-C-methyl-D-erythritol 4-phosphate cytidylyltransferase [Longimicrobium sp.]